jgi:hypothetical protein
VGWLSTPSRPHVGGRWTATVNLETCSSPDATRRLDSSRGRYRSPLETPGSGWTTAQRESPRTGSTPPFTRSHRAGSTRQRPCAPCGRVTVCARFACGIDRVPATGNESSPGGALMSRHGDFLRWLYRRGHPNRLARMLNQVSATAFRCGVWPLHGATREVRGRSSGRMISCPVVIADHQGDRYLVSMLGERGNWIRSVRAANGRAVRCHGTRETVQLDEVPSSDRAAILRRYPSLAPGARPRVPLDRNASLDEFEKTAPGSPGVRLSLMSQATVSPAAGGDGRRPRSLR